MHALVLADGDLPSAAELDEAWPGWDSGVELVVAADGGARGAPGLGRPVDLLVGDLDSLGEAAVATLESSGVAVVRSPVAKDESDTELAILAALARGADRLTVLGALGGRRIDHELANVQLLAHPALAGIECVLLDPRARLRLLAAPAPEGGPADLELPGRPGTTVSLMPLGGSVEGVTTRGLAYPLADESLELGPARGLSNVRSDAEAGISLRSGRLLVIETPATLDG